MPKPKKNRKNTWVDMTAFVDVAFLILSFFMLVAKFKPSELIPIDIPNSASSEAVEDKDNSLTIVMEKSGKVFIELEPEIRKNIILKLNQSRNLELNKKEITNFIAAETIGVSLNQLKGFLSLPKQKNFSPPGIPMNENGGELFIWIKELKFLTKGKKVKWFVKGDTKTSYNVFKNVLKALKSNDLNKFLLITNPSAPPIGSALYEKGLLHP